MADVPSTRVVCLGKSVTRADSRSPKLSGTVLHSSDEPGELLQCQCHDDSTTNTVMAITGPFVGKP